MPLNFILSMAVDCPLVTAMDRLWFFHIILLPEPVSVICSKSIVASPMVAIVETATSSLLDTSDLSHEDDNSKESSSPDSTSHQDDCNNNIEGEKKLEKTKEKKRPTRLRLDLISNKRRSQSSSPSIHRPCKSLNFLDDMDERLNIQRTLNFNLPHVLELEELQGFLNLGFQFENDQVSPRTMSMIPGLQRLSGNEGNFSQNYATILRKDKEGDNEEEKKEVMRPYLSEAWLVKRPNSPLLRLRMARVTTNEEMKKCLKLWARTVASSIQS